MFGFGTLGSRVIGLFGILLLYLAGSLLTMINLPNKIAEAGIPESVYVMNVYMVVFMIGTWSVFWLVQPMQKGHLYYLPTKEGWFSLFLNGIFGVVLGHFLLLQALPLLSTDLYLQMELLVGPMMEQWAMGILLVVKMVVWFFRTTIVVPEGWSICIPDTNRPGGGVVYPGPKMVHTRPWNRYSMFDDEAMRSFGEEVASSEEEEGEEAASAVS